MRKSKRITMSAWLVGIIITLAVTGMYMASWGPLMSLENRAYDMRARMVRSDARSPIVIVEIDEASIEEIGRWPWDRATLATAVELLAAYEAKVIGMNIMFPEEKFDPGQKVLSEILFQVQEMKGFKRNKPLNEVADMLDEGLVRLDGDAALEESIEGAGNVVLPLIISVDTTIKEWVAMNISYPPFLIANTAAAPAPPEAWSAADEPIMPYPDLMMRAGGLGHIALLHDHDGNWRRVPLLIEYSGRYMPSFSLSIAMKYLDRPVKSMDTTGGVSFGPINIPTNDKKEMLVKQRGDGVEFAANYKHISFIELLNQDVTASDIKDKIVLIGLNAHGLTTFGTTYLYPNMPAVEYHATAIDNILTGDFFSRPPWARNAELGALAFMGLVLSFLVPRLRAVFSAVLTLLLFAGWVGAGFYMFRSQGYWLMIVPHSILIIGGYIAVVSLRYMAAEQRSDKFQSANIETNKMLGISFQSQGMLDLALEKFMKCPVEEEDIKNNMYNLALDFERKRQFNKAVSIYQHIKTAGDYKDIDEKIEKLTRAGETMIFGGSQLGGGKKDATMIVDGTDMAPTLGRYEVQKELGKGAMGIVYLGLDPKINRKVAIKTIRFDEVDDTLIKDVKERFFREAEAAGRLSHPNIVTIYDAGEDQDLAYVAMELLDGKDLSDIIAEKGKCPPKTAIQIAGQVADALNYAGKQGIVHRDIKPANIMMLKKGGVKVTDFGIARVVESSKTQTGVVLGTPSYMSPEQVAGKKVDSRSDIFSLGVMFYELLSGKKPFTGDSLATLMYNIANNPHTPVKEIAPEVPDCCATIVERFLAKDLEKRYQSGAQAVKDLKACYQAISAAGKGAQ